MNYPCFLENVSFFAVLPLATPTGDESHRVLLVDLPLRRQTHRLDKLVVFDRQRKLEKRNVVVVGAFGVFFMTNYHAHTPYYLVA